MEEKSFTNRFIIDLVVDFLENNSNSYSKKITNVLIKEINKNDKNLANKFKNLFNSSTVIQGGITRNKSSGESSIPMDNNNSLLIDISNVEINQDLIIWNEDIKKSLHQIILEYKYKLKLHKDGLKPIQTVLFHGLPGVGKTLAAQYLAKKLGLPLYVLDLATVMSSYLGKTGGNIKTVFEFAAKNECVLFLDEFDAVAKQRGDETEIGELKRLVTVLLQSIDTWNDNSILIAATNHQELLDRAIWRRFDEVIEFELPTSNAISSMINKYFNDLPIELIEILSKLCIGKSHADITRICLKIKKNISLNNINTIEAVSDYILKNNLLLDKELKVLFATILVKELKFSQRKISELLNISRDTIRKHL
jgi:AAA+ superfamily predicted ATPase